MAVSNSFSSKFGLKKVFWFGLIRILGSRHTLLCPCQVPTACSHNLASFFVLKQLCIAIHPILTISDQFSSRTCILPAPLAPLAVFYIWHLFVLRPALHIWIKAEPLTKFYQSWSKPIGRIAPLHFLSALKVSEAPRQSLKSLQLPKSYRFPKPALLLYYSVYL